MKMLPMAPLVAQLVEMARDRVPETGDAQSVASLSVTVPAHACVPLHPQLHVKGAPVALV
jgi:hypothetical protein